MITERDMVVASGRLAYVDSMGGLLPCRVIAVRGGTGKPERCTSRIKCDVVLTARRGAWKRGEVLRDYASYRIVPRSAVLGLRSRKPGTLRIMRGYYVQADATE